MRDLPLYRTKAEFFRTLGHPARIRILELLCAGERSVADMLPDIGVEQANLSQHLAVLRHAGLVTSRREGSFVRYALTSPDVAGLLAVARRILTGVAAGQMDLLVADGDEPAGSNVGRPPGRTIGRRAEEKKESRT